MPARPDERFAADGMHGGPRDRHPVTVGSWGALADVAGDRLAAGSAQR